MHDVKVRECLKVFVWLMNSYLVSNYLRHMEHKHLVLYTLAQMVAESAQPSLYQFIPRELILRLPIEWSTIYSCLSALEEEGAVQIFQSNTSKFSITKKGLNVSNQYNAQSVN